MEFLSRLEFREETHAEDVHWGLKVMKLDEEDELEKGRGYEVESWDTPTLRGLGKIRENEQRTQREVRRIKGVLSRKKSKDSISRRREG